MKLIVRSLSKLTVRRVVRRMIRAVDTLCWTGILMVKLRYNRVSFGRRVRATGPVHLVVHPDGSMRIGDGVLINSGSRRNPVGGGGRCIIDVGARAHLEIGANTGMSNCEIICRKRIVISEYCLLGGGSRIYDSDFHSTDGVMRRSRPDQGIRSESVEVGSDVFVGAHATILKGVKVGPRAVIGAGAVVTKAVACEEIWAGNPARRVGSAGEKAVERQERQ